MRLFLSIEEGTEGKCFSIEEGRSASNLSTHEKPESLEPNTERQRQRRRERETDRRSDRDRVRGTACGPGGWMLRPAAVRPPRGRAGERHAALPEKRAAIATYGSPADRHHPPSAAPSLQYTGNTLPITGAGLPSRRRCRHPRPRRGPRRPLTGQRATTDRQSPDGAAQAAALKQGLPEDGDRAHLTARSIASWWRCIELVTIYLLYRCRGSKRHSDGGCSGDKIQNNYFHRSRALLFNLATSP